MTTTSPPPVPTAPDAPAAAAALDDDDDTAPIWTREDYAHFARHALPALRAWALGGLARHHGADARTPPVLAEALSDPSLPVQNAALVALGELAANPAREPEAAAPALAALGAYAARRAAPARLRVDARRVRETLAAPPPARPEPPAPEALRARLDAITDETPSDALDALVRDLAAQPAVLRPWAPAVLQGELAALPARVAWTALGEQPARWAPRQVLAHLVRALDEGEFTTPWDVLERLGDPAALPAVVREWRPGERRVARLGVLLAALAARRAGAPAELPEPLAREGGEALARAAEADAVLLGAEDPRAAVARTSTAQPFVLPLRCNECGRVYWYEVERAYMHPDPAACERDGWDGVALQRVVVCKRCGAEDDYALTSWAQIELAAEVMRASGQAGPVPARPRVVLGVPGLWDGTVMRRPSAALRHLRALAEKKPSAEAWRRLGNFAERVARFDEAEAAWQQAVALDDADMAAGRPAPYAPGEADAAQGYARYLFARGRRAEAWPYLARSVARLALAASADPSRPEQVHRVLTALRDAAGASAEPPLRLALAWRAGDGGGSAAAGEVGRGAIDPRRFAQWDALEALLASVELVTLELVAGSAAVVTTEETQAVTSALAHASATVGVRDARVGRNDPCPCGSGRKFKKCCGR